MNNSLLITKRDGTKERINLDKIHRVIEWAVKGLQNVSVFRSLGYQQRVKTTSFESYAHKLVDSKSLNLGKQSTTVQPEGLVLLTQLLRVLCKLARSPPHKF
ncbi:hypothetical protein PL78_03400 [Yersinia entomophaga]|uniref:ATP-cone domain-containing protein n=1 Tax=Yersinia entomophaga TaxID=935293 RepID=A0ABM6BHB9_YERET|nr:ATP cone domain-containing protein [Yersinia entomophaga]ANI28887.1 hypothetical protein PL78_03400 [Yersinia entomophaga]OWF85530.1 hypothetical protein B4914_17215 [Yersinia entomophaga]